MSTSVLELINSVEIKPLEVAVIRRKDAFKGYTLVFKTHLKEQKENAGIDASEVSEPERRDDAVLAGASVAVDFERTVFFIYDSPGLDIAC